MWRWRLYLDHNFVTFYVKICGNSYFADEKSKIMRNLKHDLFLKSFSQLLEHFWSIFESNMLCFLSNLLEIYLWNLLIWILFWNFLLLEHLLKSFWVLKASFPLKFAFKMYWTEFYYWIVSQELSEAFGTFPNVFLNAPRLQSNLLKNLHIQLTEL